jgi:hypothetical protein
MARYFFAILLALALGACASDSPVSLPASAQAPSTDLVLIEATKIEREAASKAYVSCLGRAAKRLDDHKSDPTTIARGMLSACGAQFDEDVRVHSQHLDSDGKRKVASRLRDDGLTIGVELVLKNRRCEVALVDRC